MALLHESDLLLSDDVVEAIVDKVDIYTFSDPNSMLFKINILNSVSFCRHLLMQIQKVMEGLISKSGRNSFLSIQL